MVWQNSSRFTKIWSLAKSNLKSIFLFVIKMGKHKKRGETEPPMPLWFVLYFSYWGAEITSDIKISFDIFRTYLILWLILLTKNIFFRCIIRWVENTTSAWTLVYKLATEEQRNSLELVAEQNCTRSSSFMILCASLGCWCMLGLGIIK